MRYKVITNGFDDLDELAKMDPEHAKKALSLRLVDEILTLEEAI